MASEYLIRRSRERLAGLTSGQDLLIADERFDGNELKSGDFRHCTFANVSFKDAAIQDTRFVDCVFVGCYFRRTQVTNSQFSGCRFVDSTFPKIILQATAFKYVDFRGGAIEYREMQHALPPEPNIREELATALARECELLGWSRDARLYRLAAVHAHEANMLAAARNDNQYYRDHFRGLQRVGAAARYARSRLNGLLWGHGERALVLVLNVVIFGVVVFPLLFLLNRRAISLDGRAAANWLDCLYVSLAALFPGPDSGVQVSNTSVGMILLAEAALGILFTGLLVAQLIRWSLRR